MTGGALSLNRAAGFYVLVLFSFGKGGRAIRRGIFGRSGAVEGPEQIGIRPGRPAGPGKVAVVAPDVGIQQPGAGEDVRVGRRAVAGWRRRRRGMWPHARCGRRSTHGIDHIDSAEDHLRAHSVQSPGDPEGRPARPGSPPPRGRRSPRAYGHSEYRRSIWSDAPRQRSGRCWCRRPTPWKAAAEDATAAGSSVTRRRARQAAGRWRRSLPAYTFPHPPGYRQ